MKFSLHLAWHMSQAYNTSKDPYEYGVDEIVKRIGLQLGAVEDVTYTGKPYDDVLVVRVVTCEKHPDADKLNLCMIDDGGVAKNVDRNADGLVQVVCGAPNVRGDMLAAWIPPGVAVPQSLRTEDEPFVLSSREIRGEVSNGMLGSPRELEISENHDGIFEIDPGDAPEELLKPGSEFKRLYGLDDVIIDCENKMFTHRPDCFGVLGISREISGIFGDRFTSPEWYQKPLEHDQETVLDLVTQNQAPELVPRFTIQAMSDVEVKPSPMWLQVYLKKIGLKSINNIVDYTNFFMTETAQPLHAFDYDKVANLCDTDIGVFPRMAQKGEKLHLLSGKTIELSEEDIVIATDTKVVALAGIMGGHETEVDENTRNIIIEGANFDMYALRRSSMRHGLFTDALTRFNKGQSPLQNDRVIAKMIDEVKKHAGGKVASELLDITTFDQDADNLTRVEVTSSFINARLGTELSGEEIKKLLENVEFVVGIDDAAHAKDASKDSKLIITAPFWRMDIAIPEDIVEEVGRLYGYDKLPVSLPARASKPQKKNDSRIYKQSIRDTMSRLGANEVLTYSFAHGDLMRHVGVDPDQWAYHIRNALSPDLQYYRTALIPSLLAKVHSNIKAGAGSEHNEFVMYEFGKAHVKGEMDTDEPEVPKQMARMACVVAADDKTSQKYDGSPYYMAKKYLDEITHGQAIYEPLENFEYPITSAYKKGRSARVMVAGQVLGVIGEFHTRAAKQLKLPKFCAGFEVDTDLLRAFVSPPSYEVMSTFPSTAQSITLEAPASVDWKQLHDFVHAEIAVAAAEDHYIYALTPADMFRPDGAQTVRYTFDIELSHRHKTLKTEEVNTILDHVAAAAQNTLDAKRI